MPNASLTIDGTEIISKENGVVSLKNTNADTSLSFPANHAGIKTALNASGDARIYACRAWVNFEGTNAFSPNPSTSAIRDAGNVSSITQNGQGDYTVNFTNEMPNENYSVVCSGSMESSNVRRGSSVGPRGSASFDNAANSYSPGSIRILSAIYGTSFLDPTLLNLDVVNVTIFC